jgi:hypothetical protein
MSLTFKYWIEFDEDGYIKALHKSKYDCEEECEEYLVKLVPIKRRPTEEVEEIVRKIEGKAERLHGDIKRFDTELKKTMKTMRRFKLK